MTMKIKYHKPNNYHNKRSNKQRQRGNNNQNC